MSDFFSSDHHFGHDNILKYCAATRPFHSIKSMCETYVERWNATVGPDDTVWYIGDFSLRFPFVQEYLPRLNGTKRLLAGNHDVCFKMHSQQIEQYLAAGFASVERMRTIELGGMRFVMCHFPYRVPEGERSTDERIATRQERYAPHSAVAGEQDEVALIHGHVHQYWRARVGKHARPELNVAVDAWDGVPVSVGQILALYEEASARDEPGQLTHWGVWIPLHDDSAGGD